jgi:hypothetical protein
VEKCRHTGAKAVTEQFHRYLEGKEYISVEQRHANIVGDASERRDKAEWAEERRTAVTAAAANQDSGSRSHHNDDNSSNSCSTEITLQREEVGSTDQQNEGQIQWVVALSALDCLPDLCRVLTAWHGVLSEGLPAKLPRWCSLSIWKSPLKSGLTGRSYREATISSWEEGNLFSRYSLPL